MPEVILLDDEDEEVPNTLFMSFPPAQSGGLTQEQRNRMAQQKELALARRLAKEKMSMEARKPFVPPQIIQTSDFGTDAFPDENSNRNGGARVMSGEDRVSGPTQSQSPYFPGVGRGSHHKPTSAGDAISRGSFKRASEIDQDNADEGWRSVRKRPVPGQSFGRGMSNRPVKMEPDQDEWKSFGGRGSSSSSTQIGHKPASLPKPKPMPKPSQQQMKVLKAIGKGKSVFLTGSAGTGKSFVLEYAIRLLKSTYGPDGVYVTASTGLAACALGGTTLHSFAGVGLGNLGQRALVDKVKSRRDARTRWLNAKALVLDEISMIDGEFFDKLDYVGRIVRNDSKPFGGIQLIVTGDFYQLPPVNPPNLNKYFAFEADCWDRCFDMQVELKTVFRQSDQEFVGMLNEIRRGTCPLSVSQRLGNCSGPVNDTSGVIPTRLYPRKADVGRENSQNLQALGQPMVVYTAKDESRNEFARAQLDNVRVESVISLSLGAQVMLVKNLDTSVGLVNGARGVVVGFTEPDDPRTAEMSLKEKSVNPKGSWPVVKFACDNLERPVLPESWIIADGDVEVAKRTQVPLMLAWALSVHKCQGMTLDRVETDLSRAFDFGMVYVALSRVKSLDGLRLLGFDASRIRVHPKVALFYEKLAGHQNCRERIIHLGD